MGFSFFRFACWISFLQYCLTAPPESGALKPSHYCVETTVNGVTVQGMLTKCDDKGKPLESTPSKRPEEETVDRKTADTFEKAINFDVRQAFQSYKACSKYNSSKVLCTMRPKNNEKYVRAVMSIKTTLSQSELQSLLEMTSTPSFCRHLPCFGFINPTVSTASSDKCPQSCTKSKQVI